jgi:hypothetical protein
MNATALVLPRWTADIQRYSQKVIFYTPIVWKAFNKTIAPVIVASLKGISHHCVERELLWRLWMMNTAGISHNPIQAAFNAAHTELVSEEAIATYRRIRYLVGEIAMVLLGFCLGFALPFLAVINLVLGAYRVAVRLFRAVNGRLNPSLSASDLLMPSVGMAIASTEIAEALADFAAVAEADIQAKAEGEVEAIAIQSTEAVEPPAPEQKPAPETMNELAAALDVPGAIAKPKREPKAKAGNSKTAAAKPKETRARS